VTVTGSKFVSTAREDKYGPGEIGIPQIGIIGAGLILPISRICILSWSGFSRYLNPDMAVELIDYLD
jgi:hypothetical protein